MGSWGDKDKGDKDFINSPNPEIPKSPNEFIHFEGT
jgi:hypothetical protein